MDQAPQPVAGTTFPPALGAASIAVPAAVLAVDAASLGMALVGRAMRAAPLPVGVPWALSVVEPHVSRVLGPPTRAAFGTSVSVVRAVSAGFAREELGLLTDAALQLSLLGEARAWRTAWREQAGQVPAPAAPTHLENGGRPRPLPAGPLGRFATLTAVSAIGAAGVVLAVGRSPARALGVLVAATPTATRVGREAFAAHLGRCLAGRGVSAANPAALRTLDRVDSTIIEASALMTGRYRIEHVRPVDGVAEPARLYRRAHELIDLVDPTRSRTADGWTVEPVRRGGGPRDGPATTTPDATRSRLRIRHDGRAAAVVTLVPELDPLTDELLDAARRAGLVTLSAGPAGLARRLSVDTCLSADESLLEAVRRLQREGHVVAVVGTGSPEAMAAADCGICVVREGTIPSSADLICHRGLEQVYRVLDAVPGARDASRRVELIALVGSAAGILLSFLGPARGAARRASAARSGAALFALVAATWRARAIAHRPVPMPRPDHVWHLLETSTVLERLHSGPDGLSPAEAERRRSARPSDDGLPEPPSLVSASLEELDNPLTPTLGIAAATSAITGALLDAALIGVVLAVNSVIGGAQRMGADRAMRRLVETSSVRVRLRRNATVMEGRSQDLVVGDVVELEAGDSVPADCRLLSSTGLEVDESSLTGESFAVEKAPPPSVARAIADRHSMVYEGTTVAAGHGSAVVVAIGSETELGRTAQLVTRKARPGGVEARLRSLTRWSVPVCVGAGAAVVAAGVVRRRPVYNSVATGISLAVAAVPEGLPFVATVAQLGAASRLSRRNALVRQPATIEALGRVDTLCFDKTGTLTRGRIRLRLVSDGRAHAPVEQLPPQLREVLLAAVQASPEFDPTQQLAHPTDRAVVEGAADCGVTLTNGRDHWHRADELPFEPARGFHAVSGSRPDGDRLVVKGAPELVAPRCKTWRRAGMTVALDDQSRRDVAGEVDRLARAGHRVLAVAERRVEAESPLTEDAVTGLTLLGFVALADPVRRSAADAVRTLRTAGVRVTMVTGDHPSTAEAIAGDLGLLDGSRMLTGPEMDDLDDQALLTMLPHTVVFARTSPAHKVRIVDLLRRSGHVVAVTGDGANDAPAIKMADVGIALGRRGTNAAKEAADVVITDDRIETIADAIVEGRSLWASVRSALAVMLGGNLAEVAFTLGTGVFTRSGSALNARQLLLVNLMTDVLPAMAIAAQRPPGVSPEALLREGPDASLGAALNREIGVRAAATTGAASTSWWLGRATGTRAHAGTVALVGLVTAQLGQTLVVGRHSPLVVFASLASFAALAITVQTPGLSQLFGCIPLGPIGWACGVGPAIAATFAAAAVTRMLQSPAPATPQHAWPSRPAP